MKKFLHPKDSKNKKNIKLNRDARTRIVKETLLSLRKYDDAANTLAARFQGFSSQYLKYYLKHGEGGGS